jgi:hypothetical protein
VIDFFFFKKKSHSFEYNNTMGKKRKTKQIRPWCWYCEKDFEDDKVLVTHQRVSLRQIKRQ